MMIAKPSTGLLLLPLLAFGCYSGLEPEGTAAGADGAEDDGTDASGDAADDDNEGGTDDGAAAEDDPGRVTLHRLNRTEYNNTIRDLFWGLDIAPADTFPADDYSLGFDNIADSLAMTPVLFELYERAAEQSIEAALTPVAGGPAVRAEAEDAVATTGAACCDGFWNLTTNGTVTSTLEVPGEGDYRVRVRAYQTPAGPDDANMLVFVDGAQLQSFDVAAAADAPGIFELQATLTAGTHQVAVEFTNDFYDAGAGLDRNLLVDWVEVEPTQAGPSEIRAQLLPCDPVASGEQACAREVLEAFTPRAWRRPTTPAEIDALLAVYGAARDEGNPWEDAVAVAVRGVLISPHFIFRVELDPDPTSVVPYPLGDYEIASRLSYLLWSSMPDDALLGRAAAGELADPAVLDAEVTRMLQDPRASALIENFFGQWLWVRALRDPLSKDYTIFPDFDAALQTSMVTETTLFLQTFLTEGRSLQDLLVAEESFIDASLAQLYNLPVPTDVDDNGFGRVAFNGAPRRGLLTQAGLMSVLSHPNVTSPVRRGKWVLEQLLCQPPPAPPPGVEAVPVVPGQGGTMREQLAEHRADPACAACHDMMDPLGLGLEHYDGIGAYRDQDGGLPLDVTGTLPDGTPFDGAIELSAMLADSEGFARCTIRKTMTYALGRDIGVSDAPYVEEITAAFVADGMTLEALLSAIVTNDTFIMRRGEDQ